MSLFDKANLLIYRLGKKGLEVFLLPNDRDDLHTFPQSESMNLMQSNDLIELEPLNDETIDVKRAYAVEADWHEIPSLKSLIKKDLQSTAEKIIEYIPSDDRLGSFVTVKDAFKKVLPSQYAYLKELKDIIKERNSIRDI